MSDFKGAAEGLLLGESLRDVAVNYRHALLVEMGIELDDAPKDLFQKETMRFMNGLCRHLGDRHAGDRRVAAALADWVRIVDEYDAFDTLVSCYEFAGRESVMRRGRVLFPGPMTAHWGDAATGT